MAYHCLRQLFSKLLQLCVLSAALLSAGPASADIVWSGTHWNPLKEFSSPNEFCQAWADARNSGGTNPYWTAATEGVEVWSCQSNFSAWCYIKETYNQNPPNHLQTGIKATGECSPDQTLLETDPDTGEHVCQCVEKKNNDCDKEGNPILPATGKKIQNVIDFQATGLFPLKIERFYVGRVTGGQWFFNHGKRVLASNIADPDDHKVALFELVEITTSEGKKLLYRGDDTNGFEAEQDWNTSSLTKLFNGAGGAHSGWRIVAANGFVEEYDELGWPTLDVDPNGLTHSYSYTFTTGDFPEALTQTVTNDQTGDALVYNFNSPGPVSGTDSWEYGSVDLPDGTNSIDYTYMDEWPGTTIAGNDMLETVTYPDDPSDYVVTYRYADNDGDGSTTSAERSNYKTFLTSIEEDGTTYANWAYDSNGRATLSEHGSYGSGLDKTTISYTLDASDNITKAKITRYTDAGNIVTEKNYSDVGGTQKLTHIDGQASGTCAPSDGYITYDSNNYKETVTDGEGTVSYFEKDAEGLVKIKATGLRWDGGTVGGTKEMNGASQMVKITWHADRAIPTKKEYFGRTTLTSGWATFDPDTSTSTNWTKYRTVDFEYDDDAGSGGVDCTADSGSKVATYRICSKTVTDNLNSDSRKWNYTYTLYDSTLFAETMKIENDDIDDDEVLYTYNDPDETTDPGALASISTGYTGSTPLYDQVTTYSGYNSFGFPETIYDPNGIKITVSYDDRGRVASITTDAATGGIKASTYFLYHTNGLLKKITQPDNSHLRFFYNDAHHLIGMKNQHNEYIEFTPEVMGGKWNLQEICSAGNETSGCTVTAAAQFERVFDALGRLSAVNDASSEERQVFGYDLNNNVTSQIVRGNATNDPDYDNYDIGVSYEYDQLDRLTKITGNFDCGSGGCTVDSYNNFTTSHSGPETTYKYNGQGLVSSVTDDNGNETTYVYNGYGELTEEVSPDRGITRYAYNKAGKLAHKEIAYGTTDALETCYKYDNLSRLIEIYNNFSAATPAECAEEEPAASSSGDISFGYDEEDTAHGKGMGRLTSVDDASGDTDYQYDALGRVIKKTLSPAISSTYGPFNTEYAYNKAGSITQIKYPTGRVVKYNYVNEERLDNIQADIGSTTGRQILDNTDFQPFGGLLEYDRDMDNSSHTFTTTRSYDQDGRLSGIVNVVTDGTYPTNLDKAYSYDHFGNIYQIDDTDPLLSESYTYTIMQRLDTALGLYGQYDYDYDDVGNRTSQTLKRVNNIGDVGYDPRDTSTWQFSTIFTENYNYVSNSNRLDSVDRTNAGDILKRRFFNYDEAGNITGDRTVVYKDGVSVTTPLPDPDADDNNDANSDEASDTAIDLDYSASNSNRLDGVTPETDCDATPQPDACQ